jgi:hypothetical protein
MLVFLNITYKNFGIELKIGIVEYPTNNNFINILGTWIGKTNKKAQNDFKREKSRSDGRILWDDTNNNIASKNGYFAFIDGTLPQPKMYIYKILDIFTPDQRLREWSSTGYTNEIYDTSSRRAFIASNKCIREINWYTYCEDVGYSGSALRSTQKLRQSRYFDFV